MTGHTRKALAIGLAILVIAGCGQPLAGSAPGGAPQASAGAEASAASLPGGVATPLVPVTVTDAAYGTLAAVTATGSTCGAALNIGTGRYGERPPTALPQLSANPAGIVRWTYATPRVPRGKATYAITCHKETITGTAFGSFDITPAPLLATALGVHVTVDAPPDATINPDPSLVPLRDAATAKMKATLSTEWRSATRGLGGLTVVDQSADIVLYVVAAKGTSVHRQLEPLVSPVGPSTVDGSQDIVVYVSGEFGPKAVENVVATALHELGHIWCCYGPGTYAPGTQEWGHWLTNERSPGLYGVDKYGLMTDPVTCVTFAGGIVSCPNRFSDREMTALGFASFPPPAADPCITQALSLKSSLATITSQMTTLKAQIDSQEGTLSSLQSQISAIELRYPNGGAPSSVVAQYNSLVSQYNALLTADKQSVASYNALVQQSNTQASQLNALPCDAS